MSSDPLPPDEESDSSVPLNPLHRLLLAASSDHLASSETDSAPVPTKVDAATATFSTLTRDFKDILSLMSSDTHLEKFRLEYEKLHRTLLQSHENEKRLMKRCQLLQQEITSNAQQVSLALQLSEEDERTISSLKDELTHIHAMVEKSHEREKDANLKIDSLRTTVEDLTTILSDASNESLVPSSQSHAVVKGGLLTELQQIRTETEQLGLTNSDLTAQLGSLRRSVTLTKKKQITLKRGIKREESRLRRLESKVSERTGTVTGIRQRVQELDTETAATRERIQGELANEGDRLAREMEKIDRDCEHQQERTRILLTENEDARSEMVMLNQELTGAIQDITDLETNRLATMAEITEVKRQCQRMTDHLGELSDVVEQKKLANSELMQRNAALGQEKERQYQELEEKQRVAEEAKRRRFAEQSKLEDLQHAKNVLQSHSDRNERETRRLQETGTKQKLAVRHQQRRVEILQRECENLLKTIFSYQRERDKYKRDARAANDRHARAEEELGIQRRQTAELQHRIEGKSAKIKQQECLYESVRTDRNLYSKRLIETRKEISQMKKEFGVMKKHRDQLSEEIKAKDIRVVKMQTDMDGVKKRHLRLEKKTRQLEKRKTELVESIAVEEREISELEAILRSGDREQHDQEKDLNEIQTDRDILSSQLIKRNAEIALLYQKIQLQETLLKKGQREFEIESTKLRLLQEEMKTLNAAIAEVEPRVQDLYRLRKETHQLDAEVRREQTRCRALSDELNNPINVHRWRKLEGTDSTTFENLQKIMLLQKRLIRKQDEIARKKRIVSRRRKRVATLKNLLSRQPGPEIREQLDMFQEAILRKDAQLRLMDNECATHRSRSDGQKRTIQDLRKQMIQVRRNCFDEKQRERDRRQRLAASAPQSVARVIPTNVHSLNVPQFAGGGFRIN